MSIHYRNDNPNGITAPNPEEEHNIVSHITKHRGMKTPYTSVSEDINAIKHFQGVTYKTDSDIIEADKHIFITHAELLQQLQNIIQTTKKTR